MAAFPIDHNPAPALSNLAHLLFGVWRHLYPCREMPRYQVFQTPPAGLVLEYHADVYLAAHLQHNNHT